MDPERHEEIGRIFNAARETPAHERSAFLDEACVGDDALRAEVESLLSYEDPAPHEPAAAGELRDGDPRVVGPYEVLGVLGEGGFGVVYLAERHEPIHQRVALKLIKRGMDSAVVIDRFEQERSALAVMDHPGVARVFDAGSTDDGRPFFVMEYVKGELITDYCRTHALSVRERLELFERVCAAVQHAHTKGIIHRDIKPSNVLVQAPAQPSESPSPKIIDFGVAKAIAAELTTKTVFTHEGQLIGTPVYMSPEQAEMSFVDIDTRADIYSLGVLLYELLTGTTPFDADELLGYGLAEMMRIIREDEPPKPSTRISSLLELGGDEPQRHGGARRTGALLRGDLDWVVMKCLEKDRTRRYETAAQLGQDIVRHLKDEPVLAGPPRATYKVRKFIKRHRVPVGAASGVVVTLVCGLAAMSFLYAWARDQQALSASQATVAMSALQDVTGRRVDGASMDEVDAVTELAASARGLFADLVDARDEAELRAAQLQRVAEFQSEQLAALDAELMGEQWRRSLLDATPEDERPGLTRLFSEIDFTGLALESLDANIFDQTLEAISARFGDQPLVAAQLLQTQADTLARLGLYPAAMQPQRDALETRRAELGESDPLTLASIRAMGWLLLNQGRAEEADPYLEEALDARRRLLGDAHPDTIESINDMGSLCIDRRDLDGAEAYFTEALALAAALDEDHPEHLKSINNMGALRGYQGRFSDAEPFYRESQERTRRIFGAEDQRTLTAANNLGAALFRSGDVNGAEQQFREVLRIRRVRLGDEHLYTLLSMNNLGVILERLERYEEAEELHREALAGRMAALGADHPHTHSSMHNLGAALARQGRLDEARTHLRAAVDGLTQARGGDHPETLMSIAKLGDVLIRSERFDEAFELLEGAEPAARATWTGARLSQLTLFLVYLGQAQSAKGDDESAEATLIEAYEIGRPRPAQLDAARALADLFHRRHEVEPDQGHDESAALWRSRADSPEG